MRAIDGYEGSLTVRCALRLAALVFVRPGELRQAEWAAVDLDVGEWLYTVTMTNMPHIVPLSAQAVAILRELKPVTGRGRFVFWSGRSSQRPMSDNAILAAMRRMGIAKEEMSGHGFRSPPVVGVDVQNALPQSGRRERTRDLLHVTAPLVYCYM
jgi:integrase